jgi:hypothetical protein
VQQQRECNNNVREACQPYVAMIFLSATQTEDDTAFAAAVQVASAAVHGDTRAGMFDGVDILGGTVGGGAVPLLFGYFDFIASTS